MTGTVFFIFRFHRSFKEELMSPRYIFMSLWCIFLMHLKGDTVIFTNGVGAGSVYLRSRSNKSVPMTFPTLYHRIMWWYPEPSRAAVLGAVE